MLKDITKADRNIRECKTSLKERKSIIKLTLICLILQITFLYLNFRILPSGCQYLEGMRLGHSDVDPIISRLCHPWSLSLLTY
jgi:hypothetical protein